MSAPYKPAPSGLVVAGRAPCGPGEAVLSSEPGDGTMGDFGARWTVTMQDASVVRWSCDFLWTAAGEARARAMFTELTATSAAAVSR